jgi:hypothetical protein
MLLMIAAPSLRRRTGESTAEVCVHRRPVVRVAINLWRTHDMPTGCAQKVVKSDNNFGRNHVVLDHFPQRARVV